MKRRKVLSILVSAVLGLTFTTASTTLAGDFPLPGWPKGIICGGGSPGSSYYSLMVGVSELSTKYLSVKGTAIATAAGSGPAIRGIGMGELDFGPASDMNAFWACKGTGPFKGKAVKNIRSVAGSNSVVFTLATNAKYGIKSIKDLKGSGYNISVSIKGSQIFSMMAAAVLEFYGIGPQDVKDIPHLDKEDAVAGLKEGRFKVISEASYTTHAMPYFMELDRDIDMRFIPLSKECMTYVGEKIQGVITETIPPGLYKGVTEDIPALALAMGVFCRAELPDNFIYELCKLIFEPPSRAEWERLAPHHKAYIPEKIKYFLTPVHAGAVKYYKEKGVWTDKAETYRKETLAAMGMDR